MSWQRPKSHAGAQSGQSVGQLAQRVLHTFPTGDSKSHGVWDFGSVEENQAPDPGPAEGKGLRATEQPSQSEGHFVNLAATSISSHTFLRTVLLEGSRPTAATDLPSTSCLHAVPQGFLQTRGDLAAPTQ